MQWRKVYWLYFSFLAFLSAYVYTILSFPYFVNPDAISYVAVAEHIVDGNFNQSVNGYWSPLISWLLVPFLFFIKNGFVAFWIVNGLLGILIVFLVYKILNSLTVLTSIIHSLLISTSILVATMCFLQLTADILFLTLLLWFAFLLLNNKIYTSYLLLGLVGLLLYLSKAYGFYFFIAFQLLHFIIYFKKLTPFQKKNFYKGFLLFFLLSSVWITILTIKYNQFTISTASIYNNKIVAANGEILHPCDTMKLIEPGHHAKYTAWEEMYLHTKNITPSVKEKNITGRVYPNTLRLIAEYNKTTRYGLLILLAALIIVGMLHFNSLKKVLPFLLMLIIFSAGYLGFFINDRYLYFGILLILILNIYFTNVLFQLQKLFSLPFLILLHYSILKSTYHNIFNINMTDEQTTHQLISVIGNEKNKRYASYYAYQYPLLAYWNKWKNHGGTKGYQNDSISLQADLTKYKIDYLIYPDTIKLPDNIVKDYNIQVLPRIRGIRIYHREFD